MKKQWTYWVVGILILWLGYEVMPDGPWIREVGAALLCFVGGTVMRHAEQMSASSEPHED